LKKRKWIDPPQNSPTRDHQGIRQSKRALLTGLLEPASIFTRPSPSLAVLFLQQDSQDNSPLPSPPPPPNTPPLCCSVVVARSGTQTEDSPRAELQKKDIPERKKENLKVEGARMEKLPQQRIPFGSSAGQRAKGELVQRVCTKRKKSQAHHFFGSPRKAPTLYLYNAPVKHGLKFTKWVKDKSVAKDKQEMLSQSLFLFSLVLLCKAKSPSFNQDSRDTLNVGSNTRRGLTFGCVFQQ